MQIKQFIILLMVMIISSGLKSQTITKIKSQEAYTLLINKQNAPECIIDGRTTAMFESGHIANAVNIDAFDKQAVEKLAGYLSKQQILVYCTNINRSETLIEKLKNLGYQNEIIYITDGINGWKANGYEVTSSKDEDVKKSTKERGSSKLTPLVQVLELPLTMLKMNITATVSVAPILASNTSLIRIGAPK